MVAFRAAGAFAVAPDRSSGCLVRAAAMTAYDRRFRQGPAVAEEHPMHRSVSLRVLPVVLAFASFAAVASGGIHLDAKSNASANASFQRMVTSLDTTQRSKLQQAPADLNKADTSADPKLPNPSAARIKDKIAGLNAQEIIDLAAKMDAAGAK
jgi:hypothetical protein